MLVPLMLRIHDIFHSQHDSQSYFLGCLASEMIVAILVKLNTCKVKDYVSYGDFITSE